MTPRRHRTFHDHKPPLVAFVLVAVVSLGLLVHTARSEAAPAWLRDRATVVVSGGPPLTREAVERTVLGDRAPSRAPAVADAPVLAAPPAPAAPAPAAPSAAAPPAGAPPAAAPAPEPSPEPQHAAPPSLDGRSTPDLQPAAPAPTEEPSTPPAYPGKSEEQGHAAPPPPGPTEDLTEDLTEEHGADDDGRPEPDRPIRGSQAEHGHGHFWFADPGDRDHRHPRHHHRHPRHPGQH